MEATVENGPTKQALLEASPNEAGLIPLNVDMDAAVAVAGCSLLENMTTDSHVRI